MDFGCIPFLARATPSAPPPSGGLAIVQEPAPVNTYGSSVQRTLTAVGSGNALLVATIMSTGPTASITDSAGNTWGAPVHTYVGAEVTFRFYRLANITNAPTWVQLNATDGASQPTDANITIGAVEVSGDTVVSTDGTPGGESQSTSSAWTYPVTNTVDDTVMMCLWHMTNGSVPTGVSPLTADGVDGNYAGYARGLFPTAGSNTGTVNLADGRNGDKAWVSFKAGA